MRANLERVTGTVSAPPWCREVGALRARPAMRHPPVAAELIGLTA